MYNFIFFFIYSQQIQKGKSEIFSRLNGSLIAGIAIVVHIGFILSVLRKNILKSAEGYGIGGQTGNIIGKLIVLLILILLIVL